LGYTIGLSKDVGLKKDQIRNRSKREGTMSSIPLSFNQDERTLWHITVGLTYEGSITESSQDGIERVRKALIPLIENGSGVKQIFIMRLPEKG
jgi:hypothetical protein